MLFTKFEVDNPKVNMFLINFPFAVYYAHLACYLKDNWIAIDTMLKDK